MMPAVCSGVGTTLRPCRQRLQYNHAMCLIAFAFQQHPDYPLILVANRDERYERPTEPARFWPEQPDLLAGRDLEQGGTWLGIRRDGRWAAVTNFRDLELRQHPLSRGDLTRDFLSGDTPAVEFIQALRPSMPRYGGFNLLLGDRTGVHYCSNRAPHETALAPGIYGLSNHLLDTPWPKLLQAKSGLHRLLESENPSDEELLATILADPTTYEPNPEHHLPAASVDPARERSLSAAFITTKDFGTRCTTVLTISRTGQTCFMEKSFAPGGELLGQVDYRFRLTSSD